MNKNTHALITGLFLLIFVSLTIIGIIWMGQFNEQRDTYVIATHSSVSGLNPQSTVFFRGIEVGKVKSIYFDPNDSGTILIPIEIDKKIVLTRGVFATLHLKGVTGLNQIELDDKGNIHEYLPPNNDDSAYRIPMRQSMAEKLLDSGEQLLAKADKLMLRLDGLLNDENTENIGGILVNLRTLSDKLNHLDKSIDAALLDIPALTKDARHTLKNIDDLTIEYRALSKDLRALSLKTEQFANKAGGFIDSGKTTSDALTNSTLPKLNQLLSDLQTTSKQIRIATQSLEQNPQALITGKENNKPAPGEPDYQEE